MSDPQDRKLPIKKPLSHPVKPEQSMKVKVPPKEKQKWKEKIPYGPSRPKK